MPKPLVIDPRAEKEIATAYDWYFRRDTGVASRFEAEVNQAMARIRDYGRVYASYLRNTRRCLLRKFPYFIVFREYEDHLFVIAVPHSHQRPGYWLTRIE
jgi:plasmid stabilization system protein ParE